jgi:hypothetical protein
MKFVMEMVDDEMAAILRTKTEAERLAVGWGMWTFARDMIPNILRAEHPEWTDQEIQQEVARRLSGWK